MTDTQPNPNDLFWLARYAHNTLTPVIAALPGQTDTVSAYLYIGMTYHPDYTGLHLYVHTLGLPEGVIAYGTVSVAKETIDTMAAHLPRQWQAVLDAAKVAA